MYRDRLANLTLANSKTLGALRAAFEGRPCHRTKVGDRTNSILKVEVRGRTNGLEKLKYVTVQIEFNSPHTGPYA